MDAPLLHDDMRGMVGEHRQALAKALTVGEMTRTLFKKLNPGKSPGSDGLTVGYYKVLWEELKSSLLQCLEEGMEEGMLSPSQRQSIIRLIRKKDRDPTVVKNFRPISLMNVDVKILTRLIAGRVEGTLKEFIGEEQLAFVKGRNITEGTRLIDYVIEDCKNKNEPAIVVAFDFCKAFDSIAHAYLWKLLEHLGYPHELINMIKTLYNGAESAVMNNGLTTKYFPLGRSCRQGDALSPYLFIIAIEPLIKRIRDDVGIHGIMTPGGIAKDTVFADDLTGLARDEHDVELMIGHLNNFARESGLEINLDKSEIMYINKIGDTPERIFGLRTVNQLKVTGITYGNEKLTDKEIEEANFLPILRKMRTQLNMWAARDLSLLGRVLIAKTQGISQILYVANSIKTPPWVIKEVKKSIYKFIWRRPDRLKLDLQVRNIEQGGINMPQIDHIFAAAGIQWLRKAKASRNKNWASFLIQDFNKNNGLNFVNARASTWDKKRLKFLPFNRFIFDSWQVLKNILDPDWQDEPIWHNRNYETHERKRKALSSTYLAKRGYRCVRDFVDADGRIVEAHEAIRRGLSARGYIEWASACRGIKDAIRNGKIPTPGTCPAWISNEIETNEDVRLWRTESEVMKYGKVITMIRNSSPGGPNPHRQRMIEEFNMDATDTSSFKYIRQIAIDTKMRSFMIQRLNGLTYTNRDYARFGHRENGKCTWCDEPSQKLRHLMVDCTTVDTFWAQLSTKMNMVITPRQIMTGSGCQPSELLIHLGGRFIHRQNHLGGTISVPAFTAIVKNCEKMEREIALKRNKIQTHQLKWMLINTMF